MYSTGNRKKVLFNSKTRMSLAIKSFPQEKLDTALNLLIYGVTISKNYKSKSAKLFHHCIFYLLEDDSDFLQWLSHLKPYNKTRIDLKTIKNITDNPNFDSKIQKKFQNFKKINRMLFISYGDLIEENQVLILKFRKEETKMLFWQGIQYFSRKAMEKDAKFGDYRKLMAQKLFLQADKDGNKTLDLEEIRKILQQLHIDINHQYLVKFFAKYDKDKNNSIDWTEFQEIIDDISLKPELKQVFSRYSYEAKNLSDEKLFSSSHMEFKEFQEFLRKEQKQEMTEKEFRKLLYLIQADPTNNMNMNSMNDSQKNPSFCEERDPREQLAISFSEFCSIIFSRNNELFEPEKLEIYQDMSRPMTDYFINSSHNTYLMANQLTGESSTKAYINAFTKGCRCVELDCWEGEKGEPIIYHGYTFTSKILFKDVVQTIKDYAFVASPYPVILSLENHCKRKQQDRMAEILQEILGESLYFLPENYLEMETFPSPEELKCRIIVKDKAGLPSCKTTLLNHPNQTEYELLDKLSELELEDDERYLNHKSLNLQSLKNIQQWMVSQRKFISNPNFDENEKDAPHSNPFIPQILLSFKNSDTILHSLSPSHYKKMYVETSLQMHTGRSSNNFTDKTNDLGEGEKRKEAISPKLKSILTLYGIKMNLDAIRSIWNISSIKESAFEKLTREHEDKMQDFLRNNFLRIYPSGKRVDSSNFDPIECFNFGVQMVALNIQTVDLPLLLYMAKFQENGGNNCGYLLKPAHLLYENPKYLKSFLRIQKMVYIEVISGQQLRPEGDNNSRDVVDPYVEVSFRGIPLDEKENSKVFKSHVVDNNGFNPQFDLHCQFKLACPDFGMIIFKVFDQEIAKKDVKIGWNAVSVNCLRSGFRILPLLSSNLESIEFSCLLCKIEIKDVVTMAD